MEQNNHEKHVTTLQKLLEQVDGLNMNDQSKSLLTEALRYALEKLKTDAGESRTETTASSNVNLSHETANDVLMRVIEGRPSSSEERRQSAVQTLAALVENEDTQPEVSDAAIQLSKLVKD